MWDTPSVLFWQIDQLGKRQRTHAVAVYLTNTDSGRSRCRRRRCMAAHDVLYLFSSLVQKSDVINCTTRIRT